MASHWSFSMVSRAGNLSGPSWFLICLVCAPALADDEILRAGNGVVSAVLTLPDGTPAVGVSASLEIHSLVSNCVEGTLDLGVSTADARGVVRFEGVPPDREPFLRVSGEWAAWVQLRTLYPGEHLHLPAVPLSRSAVRTRIPMRGVVLDPEGEPISSAEVIQGSSPPFRFEGVRTDGGGRFQLPRVPESVWISAPGFLPTVIHPSGPSWVTEAGGEVRLARARTLTGRVRYAEDGSSAEGVKVEAFRSRALGVRVSTVTGANGSFALADVSPEVTTVWLSIGHTRVSFRIDPRSKTLENLTIPRGGTLRVIVIEADGTPRGGALVFIDGVENSSQFTDPAGVVEWLHVPTGVTWVFAATHCERGEGSFTVSPHRESTGQLTLRSYETRSLVVRTVDSAGLPLPSVEVTLSSSLQGPDRDVSSTTTAVSDDQGWADLGCFRGSSGRLYFRKEGRRSVECSVQSLLGEGKALVVPLYRKSKIEVFGFDATGSHLSEASLAVYTPGREVFPYLEERRLRDRFVIEDLPPGPIELVYTIPDGASLRHKIAVMEGERRRVEFRQPSIRELIVEARQLGELLGGGELLVACESGDWRLENRIEELSAGRFRARIWQEGKTSLTWSRGPLAFEHSFDPVVLPSVTLKIPTFEVTQVEGRAVRADGTPLAGAWVRFFRSGEASVFHQACDEEGRFFFEVAEAGQYWWCVSSLERHEICTGSRALYPGMDPLTLVVRAGERVDLELDDFENSSEGWALFEVVAGERVFCGESEGTPKAAWVSTRPCMLIVESADCRAVVKVAAVAAGEKDSKGSPPARAFCDPGWILVCRVGEHALAGRHQIRVEVREGKPDSGLPPQRDFIARGVDREFLCVESTVEVLFFAGERVVHRQRVSGDPVVAHRVLVEVPQ